MKLKNLFKRIAAVAISTVMLCTMAPAAFAAESVETNGTITINGNASVSVNDKEFKAYKILDASGSGETVAYTVPESMISFYQNSVVDETDKALTGAALDAAVSTKIASYTAADMQTFAKAALAAAKKADIIPATATGANNKVAFTGLHLGYYVIEDTTTPTGSDAVSAVMVDTTNPDAEIDLKASVPPVDKVIVDGSDVKANEASIGDTVSFKITSTVPDVTGYEKYFFIVHDTLSKGLNYTDKSLTFKIGDTTLTAGTDYTVTTTVNNDGTTDLKVVLNGAAAKFADKKGTAITITYDAVLNENAVTGGEPNTNTVNIEYSNNPAVTPSGENEPNPSDEDVTGKTPNSTTETYVTELTITKKDGNDAILTGAAFRLEGNGVNMIVTTGTVYVVNDKGTYYKLNDGTYTTAVPTDATSSKYESTTVKYTAETKVTITSDKTNNVYVEGFVGADGTLTFKGLGAGEYTLTEIVTPAGYNGIDPIKFTVSFDSTTRKFSADNGIALDSTTNNLATTVINKAGNTLPSTGGMGTTLFYVIGGLLMAGAAVLLITKKRMSNKG